MSAGTLLEGIKVRRAAVLFATGKRPRRKRRIGRIPRQNQPDVVRASYFRALRVLVRRMVQLTRDRLFPLLREVLEQTSTDADTSAQINLDASKRDNQRRVRAAVAELGRTFVSEFSTAKLEQLAREAARATNTRQKAELGKQLRAAVGVDVEASEPWLTPTIEKFTRENVALIKDVPELFLQQTEEIAVEAIREGTRHEVLAQRILERGEVAESRAKLIARDQVGKLFGAIQEARQVGLGIDRYTWRTSNDNRVRDTHEKREGESYSWNDPPGDLSDPGDGGHPGFPINCRCWAEPDLTAILENL